MNSKLLLCGLVISWNLLATTAAFADDPNKELKLQIASYKSQIFMDRQRIVYDQLDISQIDSGLSPNHGSCDCAPNDPKSGCTADDFRYSGLDAAKVSLAPGACQALFYAAPGNNAQKLNFFGDKCVKSIKSCGAVADILDTKGYQEEIAQLQADQADLSNQIKDLESEELDSESMQASQDVKSPQKVSPAPGTTSGSAAGSAKN